MVYFLSAIYWSSILLQPRSSGLIDAILVTVCKLSLCVSMQVGLHDFMVTISQMSIFYIEIFHLIAKDLKVVLLKIKLSIHTNIFLMYVGLVVFA